MPECDGSEEILRKILGPIARGCGVERRSGTRDHRTLRAITFASTQTVHYWGNFGGELEKKFDFVSPFLPPSPPSPSYVN